MTTAHRTTPASGERRLLTGTPVADGAIAVIASGSASTTVPEALPGELSEACELCSGVVILDLARCDIDGGTAVATVDRAAFHTRRYRCRICFVTADRTSCRRAPSRDSSSLVRGTAAPASRTCSCPGTAARTAGAAR